MRQIVDEKTSHLLEQSNHICVRFLLMDLKSARAFLNVADICGIEEVRTRNLINACDVYETVRRFSSSLAPTATEQVELNLKLDELRLRLRNLGCRVSP